MDGGCAEEEEEGAEGCFHGDRGSPALSQEVAHHFLSDATEGEVWKERGLLPRGPHLRSPWIATVAVVAFIPAEATALIAAAGINGAFRPIGGQTAGLGGLTPGHSRPQRRRQDGGKAQI